MLQFQRLVLFVGLAGLMVLAVTSNRLALAEDEAKPAVESDKPAKPEAEKKDPYVVPDGTPEEMIEYIQGLRKLRPKTRDRRELLKYMKESAKPMWQAADKILADKRSTKQQKVIAAQTKFGAVNLLMAFRNRDASEAMRKMPKELSKLGLDKLALMAKRRALPVELQMALAGKPDAQPVKKVLAQIRKAVKQNPDRGGLSLVYGAAGQLDRAGRVDEACALCDTSAKVFAKSDDPKTAGLAKKLEGIARRFRLPGNTMEIKGTRLDGEPFDWNAYRGKVVLVQFWATWCGPCRAEIPNVKKNYDLYHDHGFDVVSISLDRTREALEKYVEKEKLPWPVLFEEEAAKAKSTNPVAEYYGVLGIPTLILVDKDGKVVSLNARGKNLGKELEKLLGPAEDPKKEKADGDQNE
jgi:thiol-disulfide isomerase/thioredoxin